MIEEIIFKWDRESKQAKVKWTVHSLNREKFGETASNALII